MKKQLPESIKKFIGQNKLYKNKVGQSPADVYSFSKNGDTFFLKISEVIYASTTYSVLREAKVLDWINGKLNVPELILMESNDDYEFMISKAIQAKPIADLTQYNEQQILGIYQQTLQQLQSIDISNCPFHSDIQTRINEAEFLLKHELINDINWDEVDLDVWDEFKSYSELLENLKEMRFKEDFVFSHGDITDTKIFLDKNEQIYFLDLGRAGIADRFVDIAFIERSLREDCSDQTAQKFIESLEEDDHFKRDYFLKLDELN